MQETKATLQVIHHFHTAGVRITCLFSCGKKDEKGLPSCSSSPLTTETNNDNNAKENPDVICWARHTKRELDWITMDYLSLSSGTYILGHFYSFHQPCQGYQGNPRNLAMFTSQFIGVLGVPIHFGMYPNIGTHKNMWLSCHTRHQLINWDEATQLPEDDRGLIYELGTSQHPKTPSSGTVNELPQAKELSSNPGQMAMCTKTPSWHHVFDGVKR